MKYFTPEFQSFFKQLAKNNSIEWFHKNKSLYESAVKKPFEKLVEDLIIGIRKSDPSITIGYKDAITRINKDVRFSKDKQPYSLYVGAVISSAGKKDKTIPGMYLQIGEKDIQLFFGCYFLEPPVLQKVRNYIGANLTQFNKLINDTSFKKYFKTISGEASKRIPEEFKQLAEKQPLIANKQFYMHVTLDAKLITSDTLADTIVSYYKAADPMDKFLEKAMKG